MSSPLITPEASFSEQSYSAAQSQIGGAGNLAGKNLTPEAKAKKLREACEGFESIFIQKMWQEMRNAVPKGGLLQGREERFWQDMYDQELAKSMTKAGGIGLADMMYEQLSANLGEASKSAAGAGSLSAFAPEAAPLFAQAPTSDELSAPLAEEEAIVSEPAVRPDASIYEGDAPNVGDAPEDAEMTGARIVAPPLPVQEPARTESARASKPERKRPERVRKAGHEGDSALNLAYLARREAGDKLGARAVRPALQPKKSRKIEAESVQAEPLQAEMAQAPRPGSEAALRSAVEVARTGSGGSSVSVASMRDLVTSVKLENARLAAMASAPDAEATGEASVVGTRKVRYSTNIPQKQKSRKGDDAIRMLNADNVSVNSNAGKGLAAYRAAKERAEAARPVVQAAGAVEPLTATEGSEGFSIPPLTGA